MDTLSREQTRRTYDRIGALQNSQRFYEDPAIDVLLEHGDFRNARAVFEFGRGAGRLAARLFDKFLPATARYRGVDISPKMAGIAQETLAQYTPRAEVVLTNGELPMVEQDQSYDRFVSTYVFDLLSDNDTVAVISEAHRLLRKDGRICLASITSGTNVITRIVSAITRMIHRVLPSLIGGCRPISLQRFFTDGRWTILHHSRVNAFGIESEIIVAEPC